MIKPHLRLSFPVLIVILFSLPVVLRAQIDSTEVSSRHALYSIGGFGNNMMGMGYSISQNKPYYYGSIAYGFNNEFFVSATAYNLAAFDKLSAFQSYSISYSHVFNSWFDISSALTSYQVSSDLSDTLFSKFLYGNLTLGFDWRIIYTKLSLGKIFSDEGSSYFQIKNSRYFQSREILRNKANFSFDPYASLLFGSITETTTSEGSTTGITPPYRSGRFSRINPSGVTTTSTTFGLLEIDLGIPVSFNTDIFTLELEPGYVIPMYSDLSLPDNKGFILLLNLYLKIF